MTSSSSTSHYTALASSLAGQLELLTLEQTHFHQGTRDYKTSIQISTILISTTPKPTHLLIRRATSSLHLHRYQDALADAEQAILYSPTHARAHALAGQASHGLATHLIAQNAPAAKVIPRLAAALSYLQKCAELDPAHSSGVASTLAQCYAQTQAPPVLSCDEATLQLRAQALSPIYPPLQEGAEFKAELLFFLASLHRRCLPSSPPLVDFCRDVRTFADVRAALLRVEARLADETKHPWWQLDRPAWAHGLRLASCTAELRVALTSLRRAMHRSSLEPNPEHIVAQVRAVANDLDAYADVGLATAHQGECALVYEALLQRGVEAVQPHLSLGLRLAQVRSLIAHDRPALAACDALCALAVEPGDREAATAVRAQALAKGLKGGGRCGEERPPRGCSVRSSPAPAAPALDLRHIPLPPGLPRAEPDLLLLYSHPSAKPLAAPAPAPVADAAAVARHLALSCPAAADKDDFAALEAALARATHAVRHAMERDLLAPCEPLSLAAPPQPRPARPRGASEKHILHQRWRAPTQSSCHRASAGGWADEAAVQSESDDSEEVRVDDARSPSRSSPQEEDRLLMSDVIECASSQFLSQQCALTCHADCPAGAHRLAGRAPMSAHHGSCRDAGPPSLVFASASAEAVSLSVPPGASPLASAAMLPLWQALYRACEPEAALTQRLAAAQADSARTAEQQLRLERLGWGLDALHRTHAWTLQVQRALARRADSVLAASALAFCRKALACLQAVRGRDCDGILLPGGPRALGEAAAALSTLEAQGREQRGLLMQREEMALALGRDEERLLRAGSPGLDEDDYTMATLLARQQQLAVLEQRLADCAAGVTTGCLSLLRGPVGPRVREACADVLCALAMQGQEAQVGLACAEAGVAQSDKLALLWRAEAPAGEVPPEQRARVEALAKGLPRDEGLALLAAHALAAWPSDGVAKPEVDVDKVLQPVEQAAKQLHACMLRLFNSHLVQPKLAPPIFPSRAFNPLQALQQAKTVLQRARLEAAEAADMETWRRAELFRAVHCRNQLILAACVASVLERAKEPSIEAQLLLEEEKEQLAKERKKHKKKLHKTKPVVAVAAMTEDHSPAPDDQAEGRDKAIEVPTSSPPPPSPPKNLPVSLRADDYIVALEEEEKQDEWVVVSNNKRLDARGTKGPKPATAAGSGRHVPPSIDAVTPAAKAHKVRLASAKVTHTPPPQSSPLPPPSIQAPPVHQPSPPPHPAAQLQQPPPQQRPSPADPPPQFRFGRFDSSCSSSPAASPTPSPPPSPPAMSLPPPFYPPPMLVMPPPALLMPPPPPMRPVCPYFAQGMCRFGMRCRDLHLVPVFSPAPPPFVPLQQQQQPPWGGGEQ